MITMEEDAMPTKVDAIRNALVTRYAHLVGAKIRKPKTIDARIHEAVLLRAALKDLPKCENVDIDELVESMGPVKRAPVEKPVEDE